MYPESTSVVLNVDEVDAVCCCCCSGDGDDDILIPAKIKERAGSEQESREDGVREKETWTFENGPPGFYMKILERGDDQSALEGAINPKKKKFNREGP